MLLKSPTAGWLGSLLCSGPLPQIGLQAAQCSPLCSWLFVPHSAISNLPALRASSSQHPALASFPRVREDRGCQRSSSFNTKQPCCPLLCSYSCREAVPFPTEVFSPPGCRSHSPLFGSFVLWIIPLTAQPATLHGSFPIMLRSFPQWWCWGMLLGPTPISYPISLSFTENF